MPSQKKIKVLFKKEKIEKKVKALAKRISRDYAGRSLVVVAVLKGSFMFLADLIRQLTVPLEIDFVQVSSYGGKMYSQGDLQVRKKIELDLEGKDVLLVEDIADTGYTIDFLLKEVAQLRPASVAVCVLLDKASRREVAVPLKYVGFKIPDKFVVGYGLDFSEKYRQLPYIAEIKG